MIILSDEIVRSATPEVMTGVRLEECWEIMWIAGLVETHGVGPDYETLTHALAKANELKAARKP